jgi:Ca2+-binding EF-hand superfamily protein
VFQHIDANRDGHLSSEEILQGLNGLGYSLTPQDVQQLVTRLDTNGDGYVDYEEFLSAFLENRF